MISVLVVANILILGALLILFFVEEIRYRRFAASVQATKVELTGMSHQLRTPLASLRKYVEFLQRREFGNLSLSQQEMMNRVQVALADTIVHVDRLLARTHLEEGRITVEVKDGELWSIVQGAVASITPLSVDLGHTLTLSGDRKMRVRVDALLLHGVLDELLLNAVHYMPRGGKVEVRIRREGKKARIDVKDAGIGIMDAERPFLFQKFFRGQRAREMAAGNGLGLSFAKQLTEGMGGSVLVTTEQKKGCTFSVVLPLASAARR